MDYSPWNSPGQNTEVGSFSLLQGVFPAQELNRGLLHCRRILYQLSYQIQVDSVIRCQVFPSDSEVKESTFNAGGTGDAGLIPGSGRSPGGGYGNTLQYACLENPVDREAWQTTVHSVAKELGTTEAT